MKLFREFIFKDTDEYYPEKVLKANYLSIRYKAAEKVFLKDPKMAFKPMVELLKAIEEQKSLLYSNKTGMKNTLTIVKEKEISDKVSAFIFLNLLFLPILERKVCDFD